MYELDTSHAVGLSMGAMYIVNFDPFELLYSPTPMNSDPTFDKVDKILK